MIHYSYTPKECDDIADRHRAEGKRIGRMVLGIVALACFVVGYMVRAGVA